MLLIDEIDGDGEPFEAFLLDVLSDFQVAHTRTGNNYGGISADGDPCFDREVEIFFAPGLRRRPKLKLTPARPRHSSSCSGSRIHSRNLASPKLSIWPSARCRPISSPTCPRDPEIPGRHPAIAGIRSWTVAEDVHRIGCRVSSVSFLTDFSLAFRGNGPGSGNGPESMNPEFEISSGGLPEWNCAATGEVAGMNRPVSSVSYRNRFSMPRISFCAVRNAQYFLRAAPRCPS